MKPLLRAGGVNEFNKVSFNSKNDMGMQRLDEEDFSDQQSQAPPAQESVPKFRAKSNKLYIRRSLIRGDA